MPAPRKLTPTQEEQVWGLFLQRVPQAEIARQFSVERGTISRTIARLQRDLASQRRGDLEAARQESVAVYRHIQREAWRRLQQCPPTSHAAVGWMGQVLQAQERQDKLNGLETITIDHRGEALSALSDMLQQRVSYAFEWPEPLRLTDKEHENGAA